MKKEESLKMYAEIMAHIVTIESLLTESNGIKPGYYNEKVKENRVSIQEKLGILD